jgi:hypothetical protein
VQGHEQEKKEKKVGYQVDISTCITYNKSKIFKSFPIKILKKFTTNSQLLHIIRN